MDLLIDFETYSDLSLKEAGLHKYVSHESFKVLCMAYTPFDPKTLVSEPTKLWKPTDGPINLGIYDSFWAFNAGFDYTVFLRQAPIYMSTDLERWKDIQVVLSKFSLPQNLADAGEVLKAKIQKHPDGNLIVSRCCKNNSQVPIAEDYQKLYNYCMQDNDSALEILRCCPTINVSDYEWNLWRLTHKMNATGLPIDFPLVEKIKQRADAFREIICESLPNITKGVITAPTQTARIKKFLNDRGVKVANTTAETLEKLMDQEDENPGFLPTDCLQVIQARQAAGASSVAKFGKLLEMRVGDRVHDFLRYGSTNTQRWAGAGFQVHSLPRKTDPDPENLIERFMNFGEIDNPIQSGKALVRAVIQAPPGQMLYQADYSSIEYLVMIWLTDMLREMQMYSEGKSAYIDMAAFLFSKQYEDIAKESMEYFLGKQTILGCEYQMGAKKFQATCEKYKVKIPLETAEFAVKGYRRRYPQVVQFWSAVHKHCVHAVLNPGIKTSIFKCSFQCLPDKMGTYWLIIKLPSGSALYYHSPEVTSGTYGPELKHWGLEEYTWVHRYLSPGRITENIVQKIARDLMAYGITTLSKSEKFQTLMTVHDELVSLGPDTDCEENLKEFISLVSKTPDWAKGMPLKAGGFYAKRYKKD